MKKTIFTAFILIIISSDLIAQHGSNIRLEPSLMPSDTQITKDPLIKGREYWVIKNSKGIVFYQGAFMNGKKDGVWREYERGNGIVSRVEEYHMGLRHGASMTFSLLGQVSSDETYVNDTLEGQRVIYRNNSHVQSFENYKHGLLSGLKTGFYEDNKLQEEAYYKEGQRHGLSKWYRSNGKPSLEYTYVNGDLQGPSKEYDENGNITREGNYLNNEQDGEWKIYDNSKLVKKALYKSGKVLKETEVK